MLLFDLLQSCNPQNVWKCVGNAGKWDHKESLLTIWKPVWGKPCQWKVVSKNGHRRHQLIFLTWLKASGMSPHHLLNETLGKSTTALKYDFETYLWLFSLIQKAPGWSWRLDDRTLGWNSSSTGKFPRFTYVFVSFCLKHPVWTQSSWSYKRVNCLKKRQLRTIETK